MHHTHLPTRMPRERERERGRDGGTSRELYRVDNFTQVIIDHQLGGISARILWVCLVYTESACMHSFMFAVMNLQCAAVICFKVLDIFDLEPGYVCTQYTCT